MPSRATNRRRRLGALAALLLLLASAASSPGAAAEPPALAVIVHRSRGDELDRPAVRRIFLRQQRLWDDGTAIVPVNREAGAAPRERFRAAVLELSPAWLTRYWNERYFEGVFPPITLSSDEAVRRYVAATPAAIGYVAAGRVDASVREVLRVAPAAAAEP